MKNGDRMYKRMHNKGGLKAYTFTLWLIDWVRPEGSEGFYEDFASENSKAACNRWCKDQIMYLFTGNKKVSSRDIIERLLATYDRYIAKPGSKPLKRDLDSVFDTYTALMNKKRAEAKP